MNWKDWKDDQGDASTATLAVPGSLDGICEVTVLEKGECSACGATAPVLITDGSGHSHNTASLCQACVNGAFARFRDVTIPATFDMTGSEITVLIPSAPHDCDGVTHPSCRGCRVATARLRILEMERKLDDMYQDSLERDLYD